MAAHTTPLRPGDIVGIREERWRILRRVGYDRTTLVEAAGYPIILSVHDEFLTEPLDDPRFTAKGLSAILAQELPWAPGLPLAASGFEGQRYRKQ